MFPTVFRHFSSLAQLTGITERVDDHLGVRILQLPAHIRLVANAKVLHFAALLVDWRRAGIHAGGRVLGNRIEEHHAVGRVIRTLALGGRLHLGLDLRVAFVVDQHGGFARLRAIQLPGIGH